MKHFINFLIFGILISATLFVFSCNKDNHTDQSYNFKSNTNPILDNNEGVKLSKEEINEFLLKKGINAQFYDDNNVSPVLDRSCPPKDLVGPCFTIHVIDTIAVPANGPSPGCSQTQVQFDVSICSFSMVHIYNFQAFPLGCSPLWVYWSSLSSGDLSYAEEVFFYDASLIAEQKFMETVVDAFGITCPQRVMESIFTRDLCYQFCLKTKNVYPFYTFERSHCGRKCCHRTRLFCRNVSGVLLISGPTFEATGDECKFNPTNSCSELSTDCEHTCGPKEY